MLEQQWYRDQQIITYLGIDRAIFYKAIRQGIFPEGFPCTPSGSIRIWKLSDIEKSLHKFYDKQKMIGL